jgi:hypothetical protein
MVRLATVYWKEDVDAAFSYIAPGNGVNGQGVLPLRTI